MRMVMWNQSIAVRMQIGLHPPQHVAEALRLLDFIIGRAPKCHHAAPGNHLEEAFLVRRPHVAAVYCYRNRAGRRGQIRLLDVVAFEQVELTFHSQLFLHSLGRCPDMTTNVSSSA
jgi:hypothetical protein